MESATLDDQFFGPLNFFSDSEMCVPLGDSSVSGTPEPTQEQSVPTAPDSRTTSVPVETSSSSSATSHVTSSTSTSFAAISSSFIALESSQKKRGLIVVFPFFAGFEFTLHLSFHCADSTRSAHGSNTVVSPSSTPLLDDDHSDDFELPVSHFFPLFALFMFVVLLSLSWLDSQVEMEVAVHAISMLFVGYEEPANSPIIPFLLLFASPSASSTCSRIIPSFRCKSRRSLAQLAFCCNLVARKTQQSSSGGGSNHKRPVCRKKYCDVCLNKFYKEEFPSRTGTDLAHYTWLCPSCRGFCSCAACRRNQKPSKDVSIGAAFRSVPT